LTQSPSDVKAALEAAEAELQAVYRRLWPLREAYARTFPPAVLPPKRNRTDKQHLVARCPRCGGKIPDETENT
jgi:hypothetical protein